MWIVRNAIKVMAVLAIGWLNGYLFSSGVNASACTCAWTQFELYLLTPDIGIWVLVCEVRVLEWVTSLTFLTWLLSANQEFERPFKDLKLVHWVKHLKSQWMGRVFQSSGSEYQIKSSIEFIQNSNVAKMGTKEELLLKYAFN